MKLAEAMRQALRRHDAAEAGRIADFCRFRLGWNHTTLCREWARVSGSSVAEVDGLLYDADAVESLSG